MGLLCRELNRTIKKKTEKVGLNIGIKRKRNKLVNKATEMSEARNKHSTSSRKDILRA